jgi:hypothetical protein
VVPLPAPIMCRMLGNASGAGLHDVGGEFLLFFFLLIPSFTGFPSFLSSETPLALSLIYA